MLQKIPQDQTPVWRRRNRFLSVRAIAPSPHFSAYGPWVLPLAPRRNHLSSTSLDPFSPIHGETIPLTTRASGPGSVANSPGVV